VHRLEPRRQRREGHAGDRTPRSERRRDGPHHRERQHDVPDVVVTADAAAEERRVGPGDDRGAQAARVAREPAAEREGGQDAERAHDDGDQHGARRQRPARPEPRRDPLHRNDRRDVDRSRIVHRSADGRQRVEIPALSLRDRVAGGSGS
jgi:hypothetical protein